MALSLTMGRPKLENPRNFHLHLRLSKPELEKISRISKQKNLTKTAAILKGIDLLELDKPKKFKNLSAFRNSKNDDETEI